MKEKIAFIKRMDPYQKQVILNQIQGNHDEEVAQMIMTKEGIETIEQQIEEALSGKSKSRNSDDQETTKTRRDKRAEKELLAYKQKINQAGNTDFDKLSEKPMVPSEIE